jgi:hypothetical protein
MDGLEEDDIDFDAVGSLLLDDDNLASIFELALTDTLDLDEDEEDAPAAAATSAAPATISASDLEKQLQAQQQQQQQQQFRQPPRQPPQFNWVPPSPAWRWGMPLPMGYPPPPVALQQHMMMHHQHMQRMHHMQIQQMQIQRVQQQQQQQQQQQPNQPQQSKGKKTPTNPASAPGEESEATKDGAPKRVGNWATKRQESGPEIIAGNTQVLSLQEIMEAEEKAAAEQGSGQGAATVAAEGVTVPVIASPKNNSTSTTAGGRSLQQRGRHQRQNDVDPRKALGSFWHGNGPLPHVDESAMMKVHELINIMKFQMRPLYTNDTYRDDYYFAEANTRQSERVAAGLAPLPLGSYEGTSDGAAGAAPRLGLRPGARRPANLVGKKKRRPGAKNGNATVKLSVSGRENVSRARLVEKARAFQKESKALGLHLKGSVRTPRKLLDFGVSPSRKTPSSAAGGVATNSPGNSAMSAPRWATRMTISRCVGLLLKMKGLDASSPLKERAGILKLLATEIGVTPNPEDENMATCDADALRNVATTTKGRRMLCRALPLFNPIQMRAFVIAAMQVLPTLVAAGNPRDIQSAKTLQNKKEAWWKAVLDERLADILIRGYAVALQPFPLVSGEPVIELLPSAMTALLSAHSDEALKALVKTRGGATAVQDLVARGQHFCTPHPELGPKWAELYQSFVNKVTQ